MGLFWGFDIPIIPGHVYLVVTPVDSSLTILSVPLAVITYRLLKGTFKLRRDLSRTER
ncbi:hypothetical protein [Methanopyrus sp.]